MKVIAIKDIEEYGNVWLVRYTRQTAKGRVHGGVFMCDTLDKAKEKYQALLDVLRHHDGVYIGSIERGKENARLKNANQKLHEKITRLEKENQNLKQENSRLRGEVKFLKETIRGQQKQIESLNLLEEQSV